MSHPQQFYSVEKPERHNRMVWILGIVAFVLVAALAVSIVYLVSKTGESSSAAAPTTVTVTPSQPAVAAEAHTTATSDPSETTSLPATTEAPPAVAETTTEAVPTGSAVVENGQCLESEARSFGTAADGTSLVCIYTRPGVLTWVGHAENDGSVHNLGDPCDSSVDRVAQDPSGKAIMCGGTTWVGGP